MNGKASATLAALLTIAGCTAVLIAGCGTSDALQGVPLAQVDASTAPDDDPLGDAAGGPGACVPASAAVMPLNPADFPSCCTEGAARCVPADKVPANADKALATCTGGFCVPDPLIRTGGMKPPSCTSLGEAPGVCLSVCVPQVSQYKDLLPQATCAADERCAPCISPLDMKPTGACAIGAAGAGEGSGGTCAPGTDGGADAAPPTDSATPAPQCPHTGPAVINPDTLPACGTSGGAHCLATALVPPGMASKLSTCATGLCVPDSFIAAGGQFIPPTCTSLGGFEGRCLHESLPDVSAQKSLLPQATCASYERCTPCFSPVDATDTGACRLSCDPGPTQPGPQCPHNGPPVINPSTLPACGNVSGAHCMSASLLSPAMASQLATCATGLCVPDAFIAAGGRFIPKTCNSIGGAEGRCLHMTIPAVASQPNLLQSTCATNERCTPCFNPLDGSDTGACRLSCDPGPTRPKYTFDNCCQEFGSTSGKCVPTPAVPESQRENLENDTCSSPNDLCVPTENLQTNFAPPSCSAFALVYFGYYDGVCLSDCLHFSGLQSAVVKQGDCDSKHLCVPCSAPGGAPSGAPGCP